MELHLVKMVLIVVTAGSVGLNNFPSYATIKSITLLIGEVK
jgi:hypothetical protein